MLIQWYPGHMHKASKEIKQTLHQIDIVIEWKGTGVDEVAVKKGTDEILVKVNPKYYRDIDIECLIGDASKAKRILGWEPTTTFNELVDEMISSAITRNS